MRSGTHVGANESTFTNSLGIQPHPELEVVRGKFRILNVPLSCEISFSRPYDAYNLFAMLQSKTNAQHVNRPYHGIMEAKIVSLRVSSKVVLILYECFKIRVVLNKFYKPLVSANTTTGLVNYGQRFVLFAKPIQ